MDIADTRLSPGAAAAVTTLYAEHALGLVRLAVVLTGDRGAAEDIVQDAFLGLYRRWDHLADTAAPLGYLRVSVLNGCRSALRRRSRLWLGATADVAEAVTEAGAQAGRGAAAAARARCPGLPRSRPPRSSSCSPSRWCSSGMPRTEAWVPRARP